MGLGEFFTGTALLVVETQMALHLRSLLVVHDDAEFLEGLALMRLYLDPLHFIRRGDFLLLGLSLG
jgi:hypothetical protein